MVTDGKSIVCLSDLSDKLIVCPKCGNDTFVIKESMLGAFYIGCSKCGEGKIFGPGLSARDIASIIKGDE